MSNFMANYIGFQWVTNYQNVERYRIITPKKYMLSIFHDPVLGLFSQIRYDPVILRWIHVPDPEKTWTPHVWHSCSTKAPMILWSLTWCPLIELIELATIWSTLIPRSALHGCQFQADFLKIDCSWMTLGPRLISLELTPHFAHMRRISATLIHING